MILPPPPSPLLPYTTLFRSAVSGPHASGRGSFRQRATVQALRASVRAPTRTATGSGSHPFRIAPLPRSEEHTSELQSRGHLVCRLLLEKKKRNKLITTNKSRR